MRKYLYGLLISLFITSAYGQVVIRDTVTLVIPGIGMDSINQVISDSIATVSEDNFANTDLTLTGNRIHDLNSNYVRLQNGDLELYDSSPTINFEDTDHTAGTRFGQFKFNSTGLTLFGRATDVSAEVRIEARPASSSEGWISFQRTTNTTGNGGLRLYKGDNTTSIQSILSQNSDSYLNALGGNVGIGTSSPSAKLEVISSGPSTNSLSFKASTGAAKFWIRETSANDLYLRLYADDEGETVNIHSNGNSYFNGGSVGIGTTSPDVTFHAVSGAAGVDVARFGRYASQYIALGHGGSNGYFDTNVGRLDFRNNGTDVLSITTDFKVGIGTTSPDAKLSVEGGHIYLNEDGGQGNPTFRIYDENAAGGFSQIRDESASISLYEKQRTLGQTIIRVNPLPVDGTSNATVDIFRNTNTTGSRSFNIHAGTDSDSTSHSFYGGGDAHLVQDGGSVGIGQTSPSGHLHVGDGENAYQAVFEGDLGQMQVFRGVDLRITRALDNYITATDPAGKLNFRTGGENTRMLIDASGNVGIGDSTPDEVLDIDDGTEAVNGKAMIDFQNRAEIGYDGSGANDGLYYNTSKSHYFQINGVIKAALSNAGFFGIGTMTPTSELEVSNSAHPEIRITDDSGTDSSVSFGYDHGNGGSGTATIDVDVQDANATDAFRIIVGNAVQFDIDNGGQIGFGDYGSGSNTGTETYILGVESNGDIVEVGKPGMVLIETQTASSDATIDFTSIGSYDKYKFIFTSVIPATDGVELTVQVGTGGTPTWVTSTTSYAMASAGFRVSENIGSDANEYGVSGEFLITGTSDTGTYTHAIGSVAYTHTSGVLGNNTVLDQYKATTAVTGFRVLFDTGNIESGTISLYGINE